MEPFADHEELDVNAWGQLHRGALAIARGVLVDPDEERLMGADEHVARGTFELVRLSAIAMLVDVRPRAGTGGGRAAPAPQRCRPVVV